MTPQRWNGLCALWALSLLGAIALVVSGTIHDWWFHAAGLYGAVSAFVAWRLRI